MKTFSGDKARAKALIIEIIKQAGGEFENKTNLFKAFYRSHLHYAENQPGYLSNWPIVRMPRGPGIDKFDLLLGELLTEGMLTSDTVPSGTKEAFYFVLTDKGREATKFENDVIESIKVGLEAVQGKSATEVSRESHRDSRTWRDGKDGQKLNVYLDLLNDEQYAKSKEQDKEAMDELREAWT